MSRSSYIIICDGQIAVLNSLDSSDKLAAASRCASQLVQHVESMHPELTQADVQPISDLQHQFMDNIEVWKKDEAEMKVNDMFDRLRELEEKFG